MTQMWLASEGAWSKGDLLNEWHNHVTSNGTNLTEIGYMGWSSGERFGLEIYHYGSQQSMDQWLPTLATH